MRGRFPNVQFGGEEVRTGTDYVFDNAKRPGANALVIQRTLRGAGFFQQGATRQLAGTGQAMLFTHREPTRYGYPPEAAEPYQLRYLALAPGGSLQVLFDDLRRDFGSVVSMPEAAEAGALFDEVFERFRARSFRDRFHEAELLFRLLIALYREQVNGTRTSDPVEFGYHYLLNTYRRPVRAKTIAAKCGLSREHFIRAFTARYAESPGRLLRRLRLEHARHLLAASALPVEAIARACGFTSSTSFCRAYKHRFARTPASERD